MVFELKRHIYSEGLNDYSPQFLHLNSDRERMACSFSTKQHQKERYLSNIPLKKPKKLAKLHEEELVLIGYLEESQFL